MDAIKEFSPVAGWKQAVGFFVLVLLVIAVARRLPLPHVVKP